MDLSIYALVDILSDSSGRTELGPEIIKLFSCPTQMSMKFFLVGILTFICRKNSILDLSEPEKAEFFLYIFDIFKLIGI